MKKFYILRTVITFMLLLISLYIMSQRSAYIDMYENKVTTCTEASISFKEKEVRKVVHTIPIQEEWVLLVDNYILYHVSPIKLGTWEVLIYREENLVETLYFTDWTTMCENIIKKILKREI